MTPALKRALTRDYRNDADWFRDHFPDRSYRIRAATKAEIKLMAEFGDKPTHGQRVLACIRQLSPGEHARFMLIGGSDFDIAAGEELAKTMFASAATLH
jgi:hypothetical protein